MSIEPEEFCRAVQEYTRKHGKAPRDIQEVLQMIENHGLHGKKLLEWNVRQAREGRWLYWGMPDQPTPVDINLEEFHQVVHDVIETHDQRLLAECKNGERIAYEPDFTPLDHQYLAKRFGQSTRGIVHFVFTHYLKFLHGAPVPDYSRAKNIPGPHEAWWSLNVGYETFKGIPSLYHAVSDPTARVTGFSFAPPRDLRVWVERREKCVVVDVDVSVDIGGKNAYDPLLHPESPRERLKEIIEEIRKKDVVTARAIEVLSLRHLDAHVPRTHHDG
jgi:hypothetical protein